MSCYNSCGCLTRDATIHAAISYEWCEIDFFDLSKTKQFNQNWTWKIDLSKTKQFNQNWTWIFLFKTGLAKFIETHAQNQT